MTTGNDRDSESIVGEARGTEDLSRRNLVANLLGFAAGGLALEALAGCAGGKPGAEQVAAIQAAASGSATIQYANTADELRGLGVSPPGAVGWVAVLTAYSTAGDGGGGVFYWDDTPAVDDGGTILNQNGAGYPLTVGSPPTQGQAGWRRIHGAEVIRVDDFGAVGDGTTIDSAAIQAAFDCAAILAKPAKVLFSPGKHYKINTVINCALPDGSVVEAWGATIEAIHNDVAFDMNPDATAAILITTDEDTYTKFNITWLGGILINTNTNKVSSIAIQSYMMKGFRVSGLRIGDNSPSGSGFYAGFKFAGKGTYHFVDCQVSKCIRNWWVPAAGSVFKASLTANDLIDVELRGCVSTHLSPALAGSLGVAPTDAGFYSQDCIANLHLNGGSFNGGCADAHVRLMDSQLVESRGFCSFGVHYEQIESNTPAVLFLAGNNMGHIGVAFDGANRFSSGSLNWIGVQLAHCADVEFGSNHFIDGAQHTGQGISVDDLSTRVRISEQTTFNAMDPSQAIVVNAARRKNVTLEPEICSAGGPTADDQPVPLTGWNPSSCSTVAASSLGMPSGALSSFGSFLLQPKGYFITMTVNDSASLTAGASTCWASLRRKAVDDEFSGIRADCAGKPNDSPTSASGYVSADELGDLTFSCDASGSGTLDVRIIVTAVRQ